MRVLLDTNVVSEFARPKPDSKVLALLEGEISGFISVITWHELRHGAELVDSTVKRQKLMNWMDGIRSRYRENLLPVTTEVASHAGVLRASASRKGKSLHIEDALIAATAKVFDLTLATRNVKDFEGTEIRIINPWK